MVVTINISDELAARAKARGMSLEAYVQEILAQQLAAHPTGTRQPRTPEEIRVARLAGAVLRQNPSVT